MKTHIIGALALAFVVPAAAQAQPIAASNDVPSAISVHFADLDLNQRSDARVMLTRISDAALNACGADRASLPEYRDAVRNSACYSDGVRHAVVDLAAPSVTRLYNHRATVTVASN